MLRVVSQHTRMITPCGGELAPIGFKLLFCPVDRVPAAVDNRSNGQSNERSRCCANPDHSRLQIREIAPALIGKARSDSRANGGASTCAGGKTDPQGLVASEAQADARYLAAGNCNFLLIRSQPDGLVKNAYKGSFQTLPSPSTDFDLLPRAKAAQGLPGRLSAISGHRRRHQEGCDQTK